MILTATEITKLTEKLLSEHSTEFECLSYPFEEVVRRKGEKCSNIYIPNEGVFKIGNPDIPNKDGNTLAFCFRPHFISPVATFFPEIGTMFEVRSIENSLTKTNSNSILKISDKDFLKIVKANKEFELLLVSAVYNNFNILITTLAQLRKNRKTENVFKQMYYAKHPFLFSGIPEKYLAEFFGITVGTLQQYYLNRKSEINKINK